MPHQTRRVTAADVAKEAGVSRTTVGYVLNRTPGQTISESTAERVRAAASALGYQPDHAARALAGGRAGVVVLLVPDWPLGDALRSNIDTMSDELDAAGLTLITWTPGRTSKARRRRPLWEIVRVDAVLALLGLSSAQESSIRRSGAVPVEPPADRVSALSSYDHGPALQVEHLVSRGSRSLAFASTTAPRLAALDDQRWAAASAAAREQGVAIERFRTDESTAGDLVDTLVQRGVDGVAGYNDEIAAMVLGAALRTGIDVPGELRVIGHDDSPVSRLVVPSLSTVGLEYPAIGRYLAALALHALDGGDEPQPPEGAAPRLIVRETT